MRGINGLGVIENAGPNHLRGFLNEHIRTSTNVDIAVAFVTGPGLAQLLPILKKASMRGSVRLLTGLYQCFTDPQALKLLLAQQIDTNNRLAVRLSTDPHFHWKAYFLTMRQKAIAVVGSSNLTAEGLAGTGEYNAVISLRKKSAAFRSLCKPFEKEWTRAKPLYAEQIARYERARPNLIKVLQPSISLREILGARSSPSEVEKVERQYWRVWIAGFVADETEEIVSASTDWDEKGYFWYSSGHHRHKRQGHRIFFAGYV
ncbi:MAG TPA: phospholipase D-like domain-containing protein [Tepidisphaeraceae bacterium]|jgi:HKD family nuclease|nr:phospholipase D-like domain-containing protein [Tepidisphaeraceae bacterium]